MSSVMMNRQGWRTLNLLCHDTAVDLFGPSVADVLRRAEIELSDLVELREHGYVHVRWQLWSEREGREPIDLASLSPTDFHRVTVRLSPRGWSWVTEDPCNTVLLTIGSLGYRPLLHWLVTDGDMSLDALVACVQAGLACVTDEVSGQEHVALTRDLLDSVRRREASVYSVELTAAGYWVVAR